MWEKFFEGLTAEEKITVARDLDSRIPFGPADALAAVVEADLLLMEHYNERHGCGCSQHRVWKVS